MHRNSKPKTMQEQRVDPRLTTAEEHAEGVRQAQVLFKLNHTMPYTDEYNALVRELFGDNLGEGGHKHSEENTGTCPFIGRRSDA